MGADTIQDVIVETLTGAVADECCPLQMICHHSPLSHSVVCFRCSVAVIVANVLM